ncbi:MAG: LacI family DNA-binding transcriptional regulator [Bacillota bacterium]|jgi:DNA-binding LacI/PurR family transcriptional regulator
MNIRDVAEAAGVSTATISRVLNRKADVKPETREKVLRVIEQLNFRPRTGRAEPDTVGLFAPMDNIRYQGSPYFLDFLSGVSHGVFGFDLNLEIMSLRRIPKTRSDFVALCYERRICCGVFVQTTVLDTFVVDLIANLPFVVVGNHLGDGVPNVRSDNYGGAYKMVRYLIEQGHTRIGIVVDDLRFPDHVERFEGYCQAFADAGLDLDENNLFKIAHGVHSQADVEHAVRAMLGRDGSPTAIVASNTFVAADVIRIIHSMGLRIPEDVSVAGFDDDVYSVRLSPPLTTVRQPVYELGEAAVMMALGLYRGTVGPEDTSVVLDTDLVIRGSVGPPKA